jgi:hypothetical protein
VNEHVEAGEDGFDAAGFEVEFMDLAGEEGVTAWTSP